MAERRFVIVDLHAEYPHEPVLDLPDAEHIHITKRADGGWTAVPMRRKVRDHLGACPIWFGGACTCDAPWLWRDAPEQGDDQ